MTVVINMHTSYSRHMSCHGYEGVISFLWTPLQVKCYQVRLSSTAMDADPTMV